MIWFNDKPCKLVSFQCQYFNDIHIKVNRKVQEEPQAKAAANRPTPGGREKVTQINLRIANKQMHDKHRDQLPLP